MRKRFLGNGGDFFHSIVSLGVCVFVCVCVSDVYMCACIYGDGEDVDRKQKGEETN